MDLTREEALKLHRQMWADLQELQAQAVTALIRSTGLIWKN